MSKKRKIVLGTTVAALAAAGAIFAASLAARQEVSGDEPVDIVHDFYSSWLEAARSTTTDPYAAGLAESPLLGEALRAKILAARDVAENVDPVLCQTVVPAEISQRNVSETEAGSEFLVTARRSSSTEQAIVTLLPLRGGWYIDDVRCSPGEFAPEPEFSFVAAGAIVKNAPAPFEAGVWHLTFDRDGQTGQYVPLFFGPESQCLEAGGAAGTCRPDTFAEGSQVNVRGEMTERGVDVSRLESER